MAFRPLSPQELQALVYDAILLTEEQKERQRRDAALRRHEQILASLELPLDVLDAQAVYRITDQLGLSREIVDATYRLHHPELQITTKLNPELHRKKDEEEFRAAVAQYAQAFAQRAKELPTGRFDVKTEIDYRHIKGSYGRMINTAAHTFRIGSIIILELMPRRFLPGRKSFSTATITIDDSDETEILDLNLISTGKPLRTISTDIYRPSFSLFEETYQRFVESMEGYTAEIPVKHYE